MLLCRSHLQTVTLVTLTQHFRWLHTEALQEVSRSGAQEEVADAAETAALEFLRALPLLLAPPAWMPGNEDTGAAFLEV